MLAFNKNQRNEYVAKVDYLSTVIAQLSPLFFSPGFDKTHPFDLGKLIAVEHAIEDLQTFLQTVDLPVAKPVDLHWRDIVTEDEVQIVHI